MKFSDILESAEFIVTVELRPPKGTDLQKLFKKAECVRSLASAVNVTDGCRARMHVSSLASAHLLKEKGYEVIYQTTCRDRNRIALQADLLGASVLGIENVLVLGGDHSLLGDHPGAMPVYDLDTIQLLRTVKILAQGRDLAGKPLHGKPEFCVGAVVNPNCEPLELQLFMMEKKTREGASFFQTQPIFDVKSYRKFHSYTVKFGAKVIAGVLLLRSAKQAVMLNSIPGIRIPDRYVERLKNASEPQEEGIRISREFVDSLREFADGVHIMAPGREELIPQIFES